LARLSTGSINDVLSASYFERFLAVRIRASQFLHILIVFEKGAALRATKDVVQVVDCLAKPIHLFNGYVFSFWIVMK